MPTVMKFGGSSLADKQKIENAAQLVLARVRQGRPVVAVVSAQGDETDGLIARATLTAERPSGREMDALLASGEQVSAALLAMALAESGQPALSLTGWQAGIHTRGRHRDAHVDRVDTARIDRALAAGMVPVVAGFQGIDDEGDITTLGRGGSDTTAVALAAALQARECLIYTDVSGVFSADPRVIPDAVRHASIAYDEMLELASMGARVLHSRSVELAQRHGIRVTVLSSLEPGPGTWLAEPGPGGPRVTAVTSERHTVYMCLEGLEPEMAQGLPGRLAELGIEVDMAVLAPGRLSFAVAHSQHQAALEAIRALGLGPVAAEEHGAKISLVGRGLDQSPCAAERALAALAAAGIAMTARMIGRLRVSVLVPLERRVEALRVLHREFFCPEPERED